MNEARNSPYLFDLTGAEWAVLEPLMPPPATTGRPLRWTRQQMADAIFYLLRLRCPWRMLPRHFPPWNTVHSQLIRWHDDGTLQRLHIALRDLAAAYGRRTARLDCIGHHLGLALGGGPAASFARRLMVPASRDTMLRTVRR